MIEDEIVERLRQIHLLRARNVSFTPLAGGVSSDIWRVEDGTRIFVLKRALAKLRVEAEWFADTSRNRYEQEYLRYVGNFLPDAVPRLLHADEHLGFFAMEWLGNGFSNWKTCLMAGEVNPETARRAGLILGRIHRESWQDPEARRLFDTTANFHQLRIDPYLLAAAEKNPQLADFIRAEAHRIESTRQCLVHGDFSPKNLLASSDRLVVLDCEVAWFGDPAFDLCFLTNHLLLKSLHFGNDAFAELAGHFLAAYRQEAGEKIAGEATRHAPALLLCLLLARVDGKSPVEYLVDPEKKAAIRRFVHAHLPKPPDSLANLFDAWKAGLSTLFVSNS